MIKIISSLLAHLKKSILPSLNLALLKNHYLKMQKVRILKMSQLHKILFQMNRAQKMILLERKLTKITRIKNIIHNTSFINRLALFPPMTLAPSTNPLNSIMLSKTTLLLII